MVTRNEYLGILGAQRQTVISRLGESETSGSRGRPRGRRRPIRVLVEFGLNVVLRGTTDIEVRGVVGVAVPAEVTGVGLPRRRVGGLELREQRIRPRWRQV